MTYIGKNTDFNNYKTKYIRIPCEIAENDNLNPSDKLIYSYLRNRLNYSIQNNQYDELGYYIYYTQGKLGKELGVTPRTIINAFKRLKNEKLIDYVDDGKANKIYLCEYDVDARYLLPKKEKSSPAPSQPSANEAHGVQIDANEQNFLQNATPLSFYTNLYSENFSHDDSYNSEIISCYSEKNTYHSENISCQDETFSSNNNLYNNTNNNYNKSFYHSSNNITREELERVKEYYYDSLDMDYLKEAYPHEPLIEEIFFEIIDMHFDSETLINKQPKPRELVRGVLAKLTHMHIEDVVETYRKQTINIQFPHSYLKTLIYNSAKTLKAKTHNKMMYESYMASNNNTAVGVTEVPNLNASFFDELVASGVI